MEQPSGADTLDPAVAFTGQAEEAVDQVYQGLVSFAPNSTNIVPLLAQNFTVSPDGKNYTFALRQGITFSNGDPLNAYVFSYSIYRSALLAQSPSYLVTVSLNTSSVNASALNEFNTSNNIPPPALLQFMQNPNLAVTASGPYTLQFHLATPFAAFMATLTQPQSFAVDPRVVSAHGGVVAGNTSAWMTANAVGTGPFLITTYTPSTVTIYQRNPTYWGGANGIQPNPRLYQVIEKTVPNALTRLEDLERGSAQVAYVDFQLAPQITSNPGIYIPKLGPQLTLHWLSMDTIKAPFNNTLVREAVAHAINTTAILTLYAGFGTSFVGPVPKGVLGYNSNLPPYSYNLTLAKQLLTQAGHPNGSGIASVQLLYGTDRPPAPQAVQVIQANLADIGITVTLKGVTTDQRFTIQASVNGTDPAFPELVFNTWEWFPDPWAFGNWFVGHLDPTGDSNSAWYDNSTVNSLLTQADAAVSLAQRAAFYQNVSSIVYQAVPYVWLAQFQNAFLQGVPLSSINVRGFVPNLQFGQSDFSILFLVS